MGDGYIGRQMDEQMGNWMDEGGIGGWIDGRTNRLLRGWLAGKKMQSLTNEYLIYRATPCITYYQTSSVDCQTLTVESKKSRSGIF